VLVVLLLATAKRVEEFSFLTYAARMLIFIGFCMILYHFR